MIKYSAMGISLSPDPVTGITATYRLYAPGSPVGLYAGSGARVVGNYSTGRFMPGTLIRYEPSVSFNANGRVYVGFTDNPEKIAGYNDLGPADRLAVVKGLSSVRSFPVWQETSIPFPTSARRAMFDVNENIILDDVNAISRSVQTAMLIAVETDGEFANIGGFWFHDVVKAEGLDNIGT